MPAIPNDQRDFIITAFRARILDKLGAVPFPHQGSWWAAADGYVLTDVPAPEGTTAPTMLVQKEDRSTERRLLVPRPGGRARVIADLGAFKVGKSWSSGMWGAAFAAVPNARVHLVGLEYDICVPEFEYILEALLSERGLGLKYSSLQNRPRDGRMWLDLPNGARFEARSWERKDSLKGKEVDAYIYCEAYQLPGLEAYTDFKQNLKARDGYAVFPTTPDRPWVKVFHEHGHDDPEFPAWQCICGVSRSVNPYTHDQSAQDQDDPDKGGLMTREKFQIAYHGQLGEFVGSVYNYQRGQRTFGVTSHPFLWKDPTKPATPENLQVPPGWEIVGGADTGTYHSAGLIAFSPDGEAFVLHEAPNYRYVGSGAIELDESVTIPGWCEDLIARRTQLGSHTHHYWADPNSQFKNEVKHYGVTLLPNRVPPETRTEIAREYFQAQKIWFAPWLRVLPFEVENARWPEEATAAGRFARVKDRDHSLDWLEHVLSRRPRGRILQEKKGRLWIEEFYGRKLQDARHKVDPHLGKVA